MTKANKNVWILLMLGIIAIPVTLLLLGAANRAASPPVTTVQDTERFVRADSPFLGPADAKVTIVEFFDPECESCRAFEPVVMGLLKKYDGQVRLVARYFPLHTNSLLAAATIEAAAQEDEAKRWRMREYLFEKQPEWGEQQTSQQNKFLLYASDLGLEEQAVRTAMDSSAIRKLVERDRQDGEALGVRGTPTFFVNGKLMSELSSAALEQAIQSALNEGITR